MIVVLVTRMHNGIFAGTMRLPLKQTKLAHEPRKVGDARNTAHEQRERFEIDLRLHLRAADILEAMRAPRSRNPVLRVVVARHLGNTIGAAKVRVFLGDDLRIVFPPSAAHGVDDEAVAVLVPDRDRIGVSPAGSGVNEGQIDDAFSRRHRRQFQRPIKVNGAIDRGVVEVGADVGAKDGVPFGAGRRRIGRPCSSNGGNVQR
jgi:hypothetical protein